VTRADNTHHLQRAATARRDATLQRARCAVEDFDRAGETITFTAVARAAQVSRGWLYNQPDLRDAILGLRRETPHSPTATPATQRASTESLRQRLDAARHDIGRLRSENAALREQLGRALGEQRARR
jgi:hypothetical protein